MLLLCVSLNHRSKPTTSKQFLFYIHLYNVDVDVVSSPVANLKCLGFQTPTQGREFYLELYGAFEVRKYAANEAIGQRVTSG